MKPGRSAAEIPLILLFLKYLTVNTNRARLGVYFRLIYIYASDVNVVNNASLKREEIGRNNLIISA